MADNDDIEFDEIGVSAEERIKRRKVMEKTKGKDLERNWQQSDRSDIEQKLAAHAPRIIVETRCHTCMSENRLWIEEMIVKGYPFKRIAESSVAAGIDRRSLSKHAKEHMPIERMRIRHELEEEAEKLKKNYEDGASGAISDRGMLKTLARKAYEDAMNGITQAEVKDLIQMIKLLNDLEVESSGAKAEELEMQLRIFAKAIQNTLEQSQLNIVVEEIKRLRQLDSIDLEMEDALAYRPQPIQEAEVVDESLPAIEQRSAESDRDSD